MASKSQGKHKLQEGRKARRITSPLVKRAGGIGLATLTAVGLFAGANADNAPVLGATGTPGTYTETNLGASLQGFASYRIPALTHLGDGVILAAWDGRPGSAADAPNPNSIVLRRSTDNGASWSNIEVIAAGNPGTDGSQKYGYSDPSFVYDRSTGKVFAFFVKSLNQGFWGSAYGNSMTNPNVMGSVVLESSDMGLTWSEPRDITAVTKQGSSASAQVGDARAVFASSGEGIQLRYGRYAGRLVQQYTAMVKMEDGTEKTRAFSLYSDDHGATWQRGAYAGVNMDENKVVELSDGTLMMNSRNFVFEGYRKVAYSYDGGASWTEPILDTELPDPNNNASITRMYPDAAAGSAEAKKLIFTNANNNANTNRQNLTAKVSCDDGATWPGVRQIKNGFAAYSTATSIADGKFGVLYEASYANDMRFGTFTEDWLNTVCAPLSIGDLNLTTASTNTVAVTITNQESTPISGSLTLADTTGYTATSVPVAEIAAGSSAVVNLPVTVAANAANSKLDFVFTASDGKQSRYTASAKVAASANVLGATISPASLAARDLASNPYKAGEKISYTFTVANTSGEAVHVVPTAGNFETGFLPVSAPNCRYRNLAAGASYTCTSASHTLTQAEIDAGSFTPSMTFSVTSVADSTRTTTITHTGDAIQLSQPQTALIQPVNPQVSQSPVATAVPSASPTVAASPSTSVVASAKPSQVPSSSSSPKVSASASTTAKPSASATAKPSATPKPSATTKPSASATAKASPSKTPTPSPSATTSRRWNFWDWLFGRR